MNIQNCRINWQKPETLSEYQIKTEASFQERLRTGRLCTHLKDMFENSGWMYVEWTSLRGGIAYLDHLKKSQRPNLEAIKLIQTLSDQGCYEFNSNPEITSSEDFPDNIRQAFSQPNLRMMDFLREFKGKALLLENADFDFDETDVVPNGSLSGMVFPRVSWYLAKPGR